MSRDLGAGAIRLELGVAVAVEKERRNGDPYRNGKYDADGAHAAMKEQCDIGGELLVIDCFTDTEQGQQGIISIHARDHGNDARHSEDRAWDA